MPPALSSAPAFGEYAPPAISGQVVLTGLPDDRGLNGAIGTALKTISDGRTVVRLEDGRELAFSSENLRTLTPSIAAVENSSSSLSGQRSSSTWNALKEAAAVGKDVACRLDLTLASRREAQQAAKIHEAAIEYHELCITSGEVNMRWMLESAIAGDADFIQMLGLATSHEAEVLHQRVEADIRLNALNDEAELKP
ncbi:unnamed protein product [Polarella glacialis]|uniref:Uncharacterized protein n=1 Tax=Polarella glacialis TaxID=89957 RepID=A0A813IE29_POLGL|nr:unnamed protein product [Polarella glacialis]